MRYCFLRFPEGKFKALTLSYDDGARPDVRLIETANKHGIKVTLNVNSGMMPQNDGEWKLSVNEIGKLVASGGHEIAIHGDRHVALGKATTVVGINDVFTCRKKLEKMYGKIIRGLAYADSGMNEITSGVTKDEIKAYLKALGVAYARTTVSENDKFRIPEDFREWNPSVHHDNPNLIPYLEKFLNAEMNDYVAARPPKLFYLWGHSFEFERKGNWNVFEEFCEKAGGYDDVWYATNIEICDYVNAYRALEFSVDGDIIHNPTATKVWFELEKKLYSIEPGETIRCEIEPSRN